MDEFSTHISGQAVIPELADDFGFEAQALDKPWHEKFCWEYVLRRDNGTKAYMSARPDVNYATAGVGATNLLKNPKVIRRIAEIRRELNRRYMVSADDVLAYHGRVLLTDRGRFVGKSGAALAVQDLDSEAAAIVDVDVQNGRDGLVAVPKIPSRHQSAVELARIFGLHKDGVQAAEVGVRALTDEQMDARIDDLLAKRRAANDDSDEA